ncbi:MAG: TetR/AcrR family transcriptional regulator [Propioniciclava sp.]
MTHVPDGRATRWTKHNANRRTELVDGALRAIRHHGHAVGMDEIAATVGTSKTAYYRHFGDRTGLYTAVVESVHRFISLNLSAPLSSGSAPTDLVTQLADAYLSVVEVDVEIYRFVTSQPASSPDPVLGITHRIGDEVAAALASWLREQGHDPAPAATWGHGITGLIWAVADRWILTDMDRPRADIVADIHILFAPAFAAWSASGVTASKGVAS